MFDKFKEWFENRHDYAKAWKKRTGGKVLGYFCTYVPEELLLTGCYRASYIWDVLSLLP